MRWPLGVGLALATLCSSAVHAGSRDMTNLVPPMRELRIDTTILPPAEGKVYHPHDVVLRAFVRGPSSIVLSEARTIDLNGFPVSLAKGTRLVQRALMRSKRQGWFTFDSGVGAAATGEVFCTADRLALGPFTSGDNTGAFKALACLIDDDRDGTFDHATFVGPNGAREVGPVAIQPMVYELIPGAFTDDRVELTFDRFIKNKLYLKTTFFDSEGKHSAYLEFDVNEGRGRTISYGHGCYVNAPTASGSPTQLLGVRTTISDVDPTGLSFHASFKNTAQRSFAYIISSATKYDWIPGGGQYCSDE